MKKDATWLPNGSQRYARWLPKGDPKSCKLMSGTSVDSLGLPGRLEDLIWGHLGGIWGAFWSNFGTSKAYSQIL